MTENHPSLILGKNTKSKEVSLDFDTSGGQQILKNNIRQPSYEQRLLKDLNELNIKLRTVINIERR